MLAWTKESMEAYQAYSDPRVIDADEDGWNDARERSEGTDPFLLDTDGDGMTDRIDPLPLTPACLDTGQDALKTWWDGNYAVETRDGEEVVLAVDIWGPYAASTNPSCLPTPSNPNPCPPLDGEVKVGLDEDPRAVMQTIDNEPLFLFNPALDDDDQYVVVPHDSRINSSSAGFTVFAEINWEGVTVGEDAGTVIAKGPDDTPTYRLSVDKDGRLTFSLYRYVYRQCWLTTDWGALGWSWDDGACKDDGPDYDVQKVSTDPGEIVVREPRRVFATYRHVSRGRSQSDTDLMSLYVEGMAGSPRTKDFAYHSGVCSWCYTYKHWSTVQNNTHVLRIGGGPPGIGVPYRGAIDEVQFFNRPLNQGEVEGLMQHPMCRPDEY